MPHMFFSVRCVLPLTSNECLIWLIIIIMVIMVKELIKCRNCNLNAICKSLWIKASAKCINVNVNVITIKAIAYNDKLRPNNPALK